jgi:hypothetical protein
MRKTHYWATILEIKIKGDTLLWRSKRFRPFRKLRSGESKSPKGHKRKWANRGGDGIDND